MSWATGHIQRLQAGETVQFRPRGSSMKGKVASGDLCTLAPLTKPPEVDDIVLCKVRGRQYLHLIKAIRGDQVQIGNNRGHINGWTPLTQVYGVLIKVEA